MSLSVKTKSIGALFLGLFLLFSCEELGPFGLGEDDIAPLEFLTTEVNTSSGIVLVDSIITGGTGTILTGDRSANFGDMIAKAYSAFYINTNTLDRPDDEAVLDSVKLNLRFNYRFDSKEENNDFNLKAYQIEGEFPDTLYVNSSSLPASDLVIASGDLQVNSIDSVYSLEVNQDWANLTFGLLIDEDLDIFESLENFRNYFPGLVFQSDDPFNNLMGIATGELLEIRFYFSEPASDGSGLTVNREIFFNGQFSPSFYSLDSDRSSTAYSNVQTPAVEYPVSDKLLVHNGAGVVSKINISGLKDFTDAEPNSIVNLVEFTVGPIDELEDGTNPPQGLFLYFTDDQNTLIPDNGRVRGIQQDGVNVLNSQFPVRLSYDAETRTYKNSITSYVQNYYNDIFRRDFVLLYPIDMNLSANGFEVSPDDIKLKIFYSQLR